MHFIVSCEGLFFPPNFFTPEEEEEEKGKQGPREMFDLPIEDFESRLESLKKNVGDTLTFLHQERNDFLPEEDVIIPSRKDDHVSRNIDLDSIKNKNKKSEDDHQQKRENDDLLYNRHKETSEPLEIEETVDESIIEDNFTSDNFEEQVVKETAETEVSKVIEKAEQVVNNDLRSPSASANFIENESNNAQIPFDRQNSSIRKTEEAFEFLEDEFVGSEPSHAVVVKMEAKTIKSGIPVSKAKGKERRPSPDRLSKIPVSSKSKVKTIKKHSKDPLKEFVKLAQEVDWDEDNKDQSTKSKIPVFVTESVGEIDPNLVSPVSDTKSSTLDSDSDTDSRRSSPQLKGILKKTTFKTVGSSSGSDVALHEAGGGESTDDESGRCDPICQLHLPVHVFFFLFKTLICLYNFSQLLCYPWSSLF